MSIFLGGVKSADKFSRPLGLREACFWTHRTDWRKKEGPHIIVRYVDPQNVHERSEVHLMNSWISFINKKEVTDPNSMKDVIHLVKKQLGVGWFTL